MAGSVFSVRFPLRSQRSRAATKLEPGDKKGQYHNAVSVWVVRDITRLWPDTIHGQPTRYRVVVLTPFRTGMMTSQAYRTLIIL